MNEGFGAQLHLGMLTTILRRRWRTVASCMLATAAVAVAIGVAIPPRYTAKVQIVLEQQPGDRTTRYDDAAVQTWVELLSAESHLRRLNESLARDPIDPGDTDFDRPVLTELADRAWGFAAALLGRTPLASAVQDSDGDADAARMPGLADLDRRLKAFKERQSWVLAVTFTWANPNLAAAVANRSVDLFLAEQLRLQGLGRERGLETLAQRIASARSDLSRAAEAMAQFRVEHGIADADRVDQLDAQIAEVSRQLAMASSDLAAQRQFGAAEGAFALTAGPSGGLQRSSGPPPSSAEATVLHSRVSYLAARLAALQDASAHARSVEGRLRELRLEAASAAQAYETLLRQEADLRDGTIQPQARVLSLATPPRGPSSVDPIFFIPPALLAGAIGGGLLAILLERIDGRLRSERTAEALLGLRCIGIVPRVRRINALDRLRTLLLEPFAPYTKAIRAVVMTALELPAGRKPGRVVAFSSCAGEDGKTALALSVAAYAAMSRRSVLMIDFNLPSPALGRLLGASPGPGTMEVLRGTAAEDAIRSSAEFGIDYLPLSQAQIDPLLLMADQWTRALLDEMRRRYDYVIIDCAPVISNPEVKVLISLADHLVLTLRWGITTLDALRAARGEIEKVRRPMDDEGWASSVLTQVDLRMHATYASPAEARGPASQRAAPAPGQDAEGT